MRHVNMRGWHQTSHPGYSSAVRSMRWHAFATMINENAQMMSETDTREHQWQLYHSCFLTACPFRDSTLKLLVLAGMMKKAITVTSLFFTWSSDSLKKKKKKKVSRALSSAGISALKQWAVKSHANYNGNMLSRACTRIWWSFDVRGLAQRPGVPQKKLSIQDDLVKNMGQVATPPTNAADV